MSRFNLFFKHKPTGFRGHLELDLEPSEDGKVPLSKITQVISWLVDNDYEVDMVTAGKAEKTPPAGDVPACRECGGDMYDNRGSKRNPKAPDFKCKDKECGAGIWPSKG